MITSVRSFNIALYQEHLDEASFLYDQRRMLLRDSAVTWREIESFEKRLDAHIDALVVGGTLALEVCRQRSTEGDFGELFAVVCVLCRQQQAGMLADTLEVLDYDDEEKVTAVADALKYELPAHWARFCQQALSRNDIRLAPVLSTVCGYRRFDVSESLEQFTGVLPDAAHPRIAWALGRLRTPAAERTLGRYLSQADASTKSAALMALLRLGSANALKHCYSNEYADKGSYIALGLAGGRSASKVLLHALRSGDATPEGLLSLGFLGHVAALAPLCESLSCPELAETAALALNLITGAELYEEVFVPERVEEDELFDDELQVWRERKEPPAHANKQPFGSTVRRLSQSEGAWKKWLSEHAQGFNPMLRYRNGQLFQPTCLLENLTKESTPHRVRELASEELVIRYGCDTPFETDMPVEKQLQALTDIANWVKGASQHFQSGAWYFGARQLHN